MESSLIAQVEPIETVLIEKLVYFSCLIDFLCDDQKYKKHWNEKQEIFTIEVKW
jgi:CelD/BcsL family acetyltransferase involved in cellulose biosynthesis